MTALEERLVKEIEKLLGRRLDESWPQLGRQIAELHRRFVSEAPLDPAAGAYLTGRPALAAYLAYFFLASTAQVRRALIEAPLPASERWRVLDVGSGPGPAAIAVATTAAQHGKAVDATALELAPAATQTMRSLWDPAWGTLSTRDWKAGQKLPDGTYDVIVVSHVLNELFLNESGRLDPRVKLTAELAAKLSPDGVLVLLEPALKRTARELLVVRDRLVQQGFAALAPCLFQGACPAIARPRDWCHADRPWQAPGLVEEAGNAAGLERDTLKFTYVVLGRRHPALAEARDPALFRIVSEPLPERGKLRFFGCGGAGRHPLVRLDRDQSGSNASFGSLERGDIIRADGLVTAGDGKRVEPGSQISVTVSACERDEACSR